MLNIGVGTGRNFLGNLQTLIHTEKNVAKFDYHRDMAMLICFYNACAFVSAKATFETIIESQRLTEEVWFIFLSDLGPIIVYAYQSLTN